MEYLLKANAILILFYACYELFLQGETFFKHNRAFLLGGLLASFVMPFIVITQYIETVTPDVSGFEMATTAVVEQPETLSFTTVLSYVYLAGSLFFLLKLVVQLTSLIKVFRNNTKVKHGTFTLVETTQELSPFSFFNRIVYNPNQFDKTELKHIVEHEKTHVRQWHSVDVLLAQIVCLLFWFNPVAWLYKKELQQNLEYLADQGAQQQVLERKTYQKLLLKTTTPHYQLALANSFFNSKSSLKKRIIMLHKHQSHRKNQWKLGIVLPLLTAFVFSFNTKTVAQVKDKVSATITSNVSSEIKVVFDKNTTDKQLNDYEKAFKAFDYSLDFKNVKRNSKDEITGISISYKGKGNSGNFNLNQTDPIKPHAIELDVENNSISISPLKEGIKLVKISKGKVNFTDGDTLTFDSNNKVKTIVFSADSTHNKMVSVDGDDITIAEIEQKYSKAMDNALYILNGKEILKSEMDKLNPNNIQSINVLKGNKTIKRYGTKGKDGVVLITTE